MTAETFFNFLFQISIWTMAKLMVSFALFLYIIFAIVVVRQVELITEAIELSLDWLLRIVAVLHLVGAILVFFLAIIIL